MSSSSGRLARSQARRAGSISTSALRMLTTPQANTNSASAAATRELRGRSSGWAGASTPGLCRAAALGIDQHPVVELDDEVVLAPRRELAQPHQHQRTEQLVVDLSA